MKYFTMIDVVLALLVAGVGIVGVLALFPIGLTINKETVWRRAADDTGDQFLHLMNARLSSNWETKHAFPDSISSLNEDTIVWSEENILPESNITLRFANINSTDTFNPLLHQTGIFATEHITNQRYHDFSGVIRSWKEIVTTEDPRLTGDIMPWGVVDNSHGTDAIGFGYVNSEEYTLKHNATGDITGGNFGCINFSHNHGGGAAAYLGYIRDGGVIASIGDQFYPETGNLVGPTITGVTSRLTVTPYVRIPIVSVFGRGSSTPITIISFLPFKLVSITGTGNSGADVRAIYLGSDANGINVSTTTSEKLMLKAEVSWPRSLPYSDRQKEVFSTLVYHGSKLTSFESR